MSEKQNITLYPNLLAEWDWEMNDTIAAQPTNVSIGSTKKIHWKCSQGHRWEATPNNRSRGQGCPVCSGRKVEIGYNDLASKHPIVASEWHPTKNEKLLPTQVTSGSNKRVWWICKKCGHEWQSTVANRVAGKGCSVCGRRKQGLVKEQNIIIKKGSFAFHYPELLKEWNYEKNIVDPEKITKDSTRRVWWSCTCCGHSWETTVSHRTIRKSGCPACANKATTIKNCLKTTHPHILKKWNYERNKIITPREVTAGSNKKIWWVCEKNHEWQATVTSIVNGSGCPICCNQQVEVGYNDFASINPEIAKEWHPSKNGNHLPTQFTTGSSRVKIWWLCSKGHEYQATIANRVKGSGCPICEKERKTSFPEQAIYYYLGKITNAKNRYLFDGKTEIDIYLPEHNVGIEYDGYYYHSGKQARYKEHKKEDLLLSKGISLIRVKEVKEDFTYQNNEKTIYCRNKGNYFYLKDVIIEIIRRIPELSINNTILDINIDRDYTDIMSQYIKSEKENSLAMKNPKLAAEWHPTKNGYVAPEMVSYASGKKVWWLGLCGHEWSSTVDNRIKGIGCPICANKKVLEGFNDLETTNPALTKEWDYVKNGTLSPKSVTFGSDKMAWWICSNGHSYCATISNRYNGKSCPYCSNKKVLKGYNDLASQYPEIAEEWDYNKNLEMPENIISGSNKKVWWICKKCGHEWMANPNHRVYRNAGCPACAGRVATREENLFNENPELCEEWNVTRNIKSPREYRSHSNQRVWWICKKCRYEWEAKISDRSKGSGCPCCAGKKVVQGINDLATVNPVLAKEWDYEKNSTMLPTEVTTGTHKKAWWKCNKCNYVWQAAISNRNKGRGCPMCAREETSKSKEKCIFQYDSYGKFIKMYSSIKNAKEFTGLKSITPSSNTKKTTGGFIWLLERDDNKAIEIASTIKN